MDNHAVAAHLLRVLLRPQGEIDYRVMDGLAPYDDDYERMLEQKLAEAQAALDAYRTGAALARTLDALLPGWVDLDVSNFKTGSITDDDWHTFVSNEVDPWVEWLVARGVDRAEATDHVRERFQERASGGQS